MACNPNVCKDDGITVLGFFKVEIQFDIIFIHPIIILIYFLNYDVVRSLFIFVARVENYGVVFLDMEFFGTFQSICRIPLSDKSGIYVFFGHTYDLLVPPVFPQSSTHRS